jgi:phage baseplate assembly protein W
LRLPDFGGGLGRFLFEPNTTTTRRDVHDRIVGALATWEPRIAVQSVTVEEDPDDPEAAVATIAYMLVATQLEGRATLTIPVAG